MPLMCPDLPCKSAPSTCLLHQVYCLLICYRTMKTVALVQVDCVCLLSVYVFYNLIARPCNRTCFLLWEDDSGSSDWNTTPNNTAPNNTTANNTAPNNTTPNNTTANNTTPNAALRHQSWLQRCCHPDTANPSNCYPRADSTSSSGLTTCTLQFKLIHCHFVV